MEAEASTKNTIDQPKFRLVGFDVVRLFSFWIISVYHFGYAVWRGRYPMFDAITPLDPLWHYFLYPTIRSFSFSGYTIFFLTAVLIALAKKSLAQSLRFTVFLSLAWIFFVWAEGDFRSVQPFWDIHLLLLVSILSTALIERFATRAITTVGVIGFVMTLIPFWSLEIFKPLPEVARQILVGDCALGYASWPILPWIGLFFMGYSVGYLLRSQNVRAHFERMPRSELIIWLAGLAISIPNLGAFYVLEMYNWECGAYQVPNHLFWAHFIWVLFALRLSLLKRLNDWLSRKLPGLRQLHVSKNFFLAYALQYVFGFVVAVSLGESLRTHPTFFSLAALAMLPSAELFAIIATKLGARRLFKGSR